MTNPKNGMLNPKAMQGRGGQANMQKMASMFDPKMLQQMGGVSASAGDWSRHESIQIRAHVSPCVSCRFFISFRWAASSR
jgi:hypothetical protein